MPGSRRIRVVLAAGLAAIVVLLAALLPTALHHWRVARHCSPAASAALEEEKQRLLVAALRARADENPRVVSEVATWLWHAALLAAAADADRVWSEEDKQRFITTALQQRTLLTVMRRGTITEQLHRLGQLIDERGGADPDVAPFACGVFATDAGRRAFLRTVLTPSMGPEIAQGFIRQGGMYDRLVAAWVERQARGEEDRNLVRFLADWLD